MRFAYRNIYQSGSGFARGCVTDTRLDLERCRSIHQVYLGYELVGLNRWGRVSAVIMFYPNKKVSHAW